MTTTYTYPLNTSAAPVSGLSLKEVAIERLTHDGATFELRCDDRGAWQIFVGDGRGRMVAGWAGHNKLLLSFAATEDEAWDDMAALVVHADWAGVPDAMTDEDYRRTIEELEV